MTHHPTNSPTDHAASAGHETTYRQSLDYLYGRINYEKLSKPSPKHPLKLIRMKALLAEMGNPQSALNIVHIGGTKGKGSTASMVAAMAAQAGHRCGLYTSPHLESLEERFQINGQPASQQEMVSLIAHVRQAADAIRSRGEGDATFFELTTAIAIEHFHRSNCDLVALEVGLGGRLDSTNVCIPLVTAITSIGLDHQHLLGDTVEKIAVEKAGIIKPGIPVVSGVGDQAAAAVIREAARDRGAPIIEIDRDFVVHAHSQTDHDQSTRFDLQPITACDLPLRERKDCQLGLVGMHQVRNAAVALAIVDCLNQPLGSTLSLPESCCRQALSNLSIPGRIEFFHGQPLVILDTAHNRDSIAALGDVIAQRFTSHDVVVVFGTSHDKDACEMLTILARDAKQIVLTRYRTNPRWYPPQELALIAAKVAGQSWQVVEDAHDALQVARRQAGPHGTVIVCGSFFLAAELRPTLCLDQLRGASTIQDNPGDRL